MTQPRLIDVSSPRDPEAAVIVLHGGGSRGEGVAVSATQPSVLRLVPTASAVSRAGRRRLRVVRLLNSHRGWDAGRSPLEDLAWALDRLEQDGPALPVGLVGHSLGGRTALLGARDPRVRSVVALNPWLPAGERAARTDARVLVVHGLQDRIAPAAHSRAYVEQLRRAGTDAAYVAVRDGRHAMLRHGSTFDRTAARFLAATLLPGSTPPSGPVGRVLAGETRVEV